MSVAPTKDSFFVSYTSADRQWAEWIAWQLEVAGYSTIIQAWDFLPGSNWVLNMKEATRTSERTVAVLSPDYLHSEFAQTEWAAAFAQDPSGKERKLLPVRVRQVDVRGLDKEIVYVDLVGKDEDE